jgi:hypothetical protein
MRLNTATFCNNIKPKIKVLMLAATKDEQR